MATLTQNNLGFVELAKRTHNKKLLQIAEVLNETNEILQDQVWLEANATFGHKVTIRTNLPTGSWRQINGGVAKEKSSTENAVEAIGMLESYSEIDCELVDTAPNPKAFRSQEDMAFLEGMSQTWANTLITGDQVTTPASFTGLQPRYNAVSNPNVVSFGGSASGSMTSIWVVQWGVNRVHMVYPRGSKTLGVKMADLGECTVVDSGGTNQFQAYRTHFQLHGGLVIHDTRCVKRLCNINLASFANLDDYLLEVINDCPFQAAGAVIYCNQDVKTAFDILAKDKTNVHWSTDQIWGKEVTTFKGHPVRRVDAITTTEATVT